MNVFIQTLNFPITVELENFTVTCLHELRKHDIDIVRAEVILGEDTIGATKGKFCNIRLITGNTDYLVAQHAESGELAVRKAVCDLIKKITNNAGNSLR